MNTETATMETATAPAPNAADLIAAATAQPSPDQFKETVANSPITLDQPKTVLEAMKRESKYIARVAAGETIGEYTRLVKEALGTGPEAAQQR